MKHIVIDARNRRSSTGRYTDRLIEHLQDIGGNHRFTILTQSDDPWKPTAPNFESQVSPFPQFSFNPLHDIKFARQLRALKPDLVHFTMTQQPLSYYGNIVTTTHDLTMLRFVRAGKTPLPIFWLKRLGYRLLFYTAHKKTKHVIVPSKFVANDLAEHYPFTKDITTVTYESSEPASTYKPKQPKGIVEPFIMHIGSPFPHKNLYRLIESFEKLREQQPELSLVLVGKKEYYFNELETWAKKRESYKAIHITGFVDDTELTWLLGHARAYVLPALSEGFGLPGLEAMANSCPLISSNATCLPEIYGDAAHYFDPYNVGAMTTAISDVIYSEKLRQKLIAAGHKRITQFSWSKMAQETLSVYENAL